MEEAQNTANSAFESFTAQDYKACSEYKIFWDISPKFKWNRTLNKLKSGNIQNEKDINRIKQNLFIADFAGGKTTTVNNLLGKLGNFLRFSPLICLEELFLEVKSQISPSSKSNTDFLQNPKFISGFN